ncbi:MAG: hypothetical protein Q8Q54_07875 [Methylococcales bacterium]|nr:hypothetical protein [Methylococcales bacterium]MDP3838824.1 hypothetical protein [Methylococcales bacterium]
MNFLKPSINNPPKILDVFVLATAALVTLITLVWLLAHSHYGIDLTDESFYLIWMANPWIYPVSTTQFGFIYHPLHLLLHGDISLLRQANILIIFSLAWVLCAVFFRATIDDNQEKTASWRSLPMLALAGVTATCSFIYFCTYGWLATPSYNSLVFQALLIASIGLLLADKTVSLSSIIGWVLIGVGGWLTFMAKPTSAAALGVVISMCLPLAGKLNLRLLSVAVLTAITLLITSAWVIDGSLIVFIERLRGGLEALRLLDAGQIHMFRIDDLLMPNKEQCLLIFASVIVCIALFFTASENKISTIMGFGFVLLFTTTSLVIISGYLLFQTSSPYPSRSSLLILAVPLSTWLFGFVLIRQSYFKVSKIQWGMALYFAVLPHVLAFGSNNNYWLQGSLGSLFWVLAGLVILMPFVSSTGKPRILLPAVVSGQLITVFLLYGAMEHPYFGQPEPFRQYDDTASTPIKKSNLILPKELADYYLDVKKMASNAGFQSDTPVIDMTGDGSGVLYAINAKAIGSAWFIGGFTGSDNMAKSLLNRVPCTDITNTWLLVAPDSPLKLSPTILNSIGLSFEKNFEMADELNIPSTQLARRGIPVGQLQLWKPKQTTQYTIPTCEKEQNAR